MTWKLTFFKIIFILFNRIIKCSCFRYLLESLIYIIHKVLLSIIQNISITMIMKLFELHEKRQKINLLTSESEYYLSLDEKMWKIFFKFQWKKELRKNSIFKNISFLMTILLSFILISISSYWFWSKWILHLNFETENTIFTF